MLSFIKSFISPKINKDFQVELQGTLFCKQSGNSLIQIGEECSLKIENVSTNDKYLYKLIVTNLSYDPEIYNWNQMQFDINKNINLSSLVSKEDDEYIIWEKDKVFSVFELFFDKQNKENKNLFVSNLDKCIYSFENQRPLDDNLNDRSIFLYKNVDNIDYFIEHNLCADKNTFKYATIKKKGGAEKIGKIDSINRSFISNTDCTENYEHFNSNYNLTPIRLSSKSISNKNKRKSYDMLNFENFLELFSDKGALYYYSSKTSEFLPILEYDAYIKIYKTSQINYNYRITVENKEDNLLVFDDYSPKLMIDLIMKTKSISWITSRENNPDLLDDVVLFIFDKTKNLTLFNKLLIKINYEFNNKSTFIEDDEDDLDFYSEDFSDSSEIINKDNDDKLNNNFKFYQETYTKNSNKFTMQSYNYNKIFNILDDNTIDVYKIDDNDLKLAYNTGIIYSGEENGYNNDYNFTSGILLKGETNLLLLDENQRDKIIQFDLNKNIVVQEWQANIPLSQTFDDISSEISSSHYTKYSRYTAIPSRSKNASSTYLDIISIVPLNKYDQMKNSEVIYGITPKTIFAMDGRASKSKVILEKTYSQAIPIMSCISTNESGGFAIGNEKGEIKFYNEIGPKAKNSINGFGDRINYIDITKDGSFILATCDKYLILLKCKNNFSKRITGSRPIPKRLKIKPIDIIKYDLREESFKNAKFNSGKNGECFIVGNIGDCIVVWDFDKIKHGGEEKYVMKKVGGEIVDGQFLFDQNKVLVTMKNKIGIQGNKY